MEEDITKILVDKDKDISNIIGTSDTEEYIKKLDALMEKLGIEDK